MAFLFGWGYGEGPDPAVDWPAFEAAVRAGVDAEGATWDPTRQDALPWVDIALLRTSYGEGGAEEGAAPRDLEVADEGAFLSSCPATLSSC